MVTHRHQLEKTTLKKCVPLDERSQRVQQGQQIYVPTKIVMFSYVSVGLQMTVAPHTESELETCQILIHLLTQLSWKILWHFNRNSTSRNWKLLDYYFYDVVIPRDCCIWWKDDTSSSIKTYTCHRPVKQYDLPAAGDPYRNILCNLGRQTCVTGFLFKSRALLTEPSVVDWIVPWNQPKAIKPWMKARSGCCIVSCRVHVGA